MKSENSSSEFSQCPNCGQDLPSSAKFCPGCGQKVRSPLIPLRSLFSEFAGTVLNLDSRFFSTIRYLFVPGFLTKEFFKGKDISYFRPLRLYFTTLVILYAVLGVAYLDNLESYITSDSNNLDYFAAKHATSLMEKLKPAIGYDTLSGIQRARIDSITDGLKFQAAPFTLTSLGGSKSESAIEIPMEDVYDLELDSLYRKYQIHGFAEKLMTRQLIRSEKEPAKVVRSMIANTSWMLLILVPSLALVMKLLYWRRKRFYVEHLVFLCHYYSAVCVCITLYLIGFSIFPKWLLIGIPALCLLYLLAAMKAYYQQGWFRTSLKYLTLLVAKLMFLIVFVAITVLVSLLLYR